MSAGYDTDRAAVLIARILCNSKRTVTLALCGEGHAVREAYRQPASE
jgi:hypothetical protein